MVLIATIATAHEVAANADEEKLLVTPTSTQPERSERLVNPASCAAATKEPDGRPTGMQGSTLTQLVLLVDYDPSVSSLLTEILARPVMKVRP
jgi:hypothetical protein